MKFKNSKEKLRYFFSDYEEKNSKILLLYIIFSFSFYIIYWIYNTNKNLLEIDENAPDPNRAITVLLIIPILWFLITYCIKKFFLKTGEYLLTISWNRDLNNFQIENFSLGIIELLIWFLIILLIIKYFYDFCFSFGNFTKTNPLTWYVFLSSEIFGIFFLLLGFIPLFTLVFFTIITIPAMQEKMNLLSHKYKIENKKRINYDFGSHG